MMTFDDLNKLPSEETSKELTKCCGAQNWVKQMIKERPFTDFKSLAETAKKIWFLCTEDDWLEAFTHHPKIGDIESLKKKFNTTKEWAEDEQNGVRMASTEVIENLAELNKIYEDKFGFIFIVFAAGKSAKEMLQILKLRLENNYNDELNIAMGEQHKITITRLKKLLS